MYDVTKWSQVAVATILAASFSGSATGEAKEAEAYVKCYGVAKKGQNQCAAHNHSCAAQATVDNDPEEWIFTPLSNCKKLGGKLSK